MRKFITTSNLYWNRFELSKVKEMPFTEQELERCTVQKGDLLVYEGGDCGRAAIWNYEEEVCIQNHVHTMTSWNISNQISMCNTVHKQKWPIGAKQKRETKRQCSSVRLWQSKADSSALFRLCSVRLVNAFAHTT